MLSTPRLRKASSLWALVQGLVTAIVPGVTVAVTRRLLAESFEGTEHLEAKPVLRRQLRATGVGLAAAGAAGYLLETAAEDRTEAADAEDKDEDEGPEEIAVETGADDDSDGDSDGGVDRLD